MKFRILSCFLAVFILFSAITTYAAEGTRGPTEHIFTNAELAMAITVDTSNMFLSSAEFVPINKIENKNTRASSPYYIAEMNDGYLLTSPSSGALSQTRYSAGNSNSHFFQKWIFAEISTGVYVVYSNTDSTKCLTVNPSTRQVTLAAYSGSQYQKWGMYYSGNGNALQSEATDTAVSGYKLVIGSSSCFVSNTTYTPVGFIDVSWFVPCTSISLEDQTLVRGTGKNLFPTCTGAGGATANITSANWLNFDVVDGTTNVITTNSNRVSAIQVGIKQIRIRNKITQATGYVTIFVQPMEGALNVTSVVQAKTNWCWAACTEMAGKQAYPSSDRTQWDVVKEVKGWLLNQHPNSTGDLDDSIEGSEYVTYGTITFSKSYDDISWETLCNNMALGKAIQAQAGYYTASGVRKGGHVVVIIECFVSGTSTSVKRYIRYIDPADGETYVCTYENFCNGTFNNRIFDGIVYY